MLLENRKMLDNFECDCAEPCSMKTLKLTAVMNSPATVDLNLAAQITQGSFKKKSGCVQPYDYGHETYQLTADLRVVLFKGEGIREETIVYTPIVAVADVYNAIGLLFGLCVLTMYETFEQTLLEFLLIENKPERDVQHSLHQKPSRRAEIWHSITRKVQKFRYLTGHELSEQSGNIPEHVLAKLTAPWLLLWTVLAMISTQQVHIL
jgi:hypothetical protein